MKLIIIIFIFIICSFSIIANEGNSEKGYPFWDLRDQKISLINWDEVKQLCKVERKSIFGPNTIDKNRCIKWDLFEPYNPENYIDLSSDAEESFSFANSEFRRLTPKVRIREKLYNIQYLLYRKIFSNYYLELVDANKKYYIFLADLKNIQYEVERIEKN